MSNNSSITAASPAGGTRGSHARANSTQGEPLSAGVKRERAADGANSPAQSPSASQQSTPAPSYGHGQGPESKKRKSAAPGSRGVANLTPEQLAKKRANGTFKPCHESEYICQIWTSLSRAAWQLLACFAALRFAFPSFCFRFSALQWISVPLGGAHVG